jgi:hypothetical protein
VQVGEELAGVEMTPLPRLGVVIGRELPVALGALPANSSWMLDPHIDPLAFSREINLVHLPGRFETQHVAVQLGVAHGRIMPPTATRGT